MKMTLRKTPLDERERRVLGLYLDEGLTYAKIGKLLGITRERVRQILWGANARLEENENNPEGFALLPNRVSRNLERLGYRTRSQVLADIKSGKLWWEQLRRHPLSRDRHQKKTRKPGKNLATVRTFGLGCWVILCEWLGLPVPETKPPIRPQTAGKSGR